MALSNLFSGLPTFARGIHPPAHKELAAGQAIQPLPQPGELLVALHQHAGAPALPAVGPRDPVTWGQVIGEPAAGTLGARVHAPASGVMHPLVGVTLPNGRASPAAPIRGGGGEGPDEASLWSALFGGSWDVAPLDHLFPQEIVDRIRDAGIVGLGGAAFPTHVKLKPDPRKPVYTLLLNGAECEPYLTSDYRLMLECPSAITAGLRAAMRACGAEQALVAIEDNKPAAVRAMRQATAPYGDVRVVVCESKYPMGGERQLIPAVLGLTVPTGGWPRDIGIVVLNVATAAAIAAAVFRRRPLTHRVISVSGGGIVCPKNLLVPLGAPVAALIDFCGGFTWDAARVIAGGPMMGFTVTDLTVPVTKGTGGITVLSHGEIHAAEATACIRCGRCLDVCPLHLSPTRIAHAAKYGDDQLALKYDIRACCECGCCAYVCPAHIPLVQYIRSGKMALLRRGSGAP